jgi:zinc transport system ATP-binding protein
MTALTTRPPTSSDHALLDHDDCNSASCLHDHGPKRAVVFDPSAMLSGRNVTIVKGGRKLISGIDIALRSAEIVTLIGPNGAGKTTLVRALLGLEPLESGTVTRLPGLIVGYVPQRFDIDRTIPLTVARFLNLGLRKSPRELTAALDDVGAASVENSQVAELSGGELQRVILARALLRNPHLLVLDEPARGVDHIGEADLYALISRLRDTRKFGVLLVSHDLHIVMANADRVVCINGHVCCSGRPETVAQHPEYARLFGPEAARAFAVYTHHHDHDHDMAGTPVAKSSPRSEPNSRV